MLSKGEIKRITELASCNTEFDYTNITDDMLDAEHINHTIYDNDLGKELFSVVTLFKAPDGKLFETIRELQAHTGIKVTR